VAGRADGFDGDFAWKFQVVAAIDNAHPAAPDAFLNPVIPDDRVGRQKLYRNAKLKM
jgi:hypothetical protein